MQNKDQILEIAEQMDMVIIGPGVSLNKETQELIRTLAKEIKRPLLITDDGITAISKDTEILRSRTEPTVLTLSLDEMSKIASKDVAEIEENSIEILQEQAKTLDSVIVLKDARSLIYYPDKTVYVNMSGNPGMMTSESGDVLTGIIAAMFGLGLSIKNALMTGVFINGLSGDLAAEKKGMDGITAQDIMDYIPLALKEYQERGEEILSNFYHSIYPV